MLLHLVEGMVGVGSQAVFWNPHIVPVHNILWKTPGGKAWWALKMYFESRGAFLFPSC